MSNPIIDADLRPADAKRFAEIAGTWNRLQLHLDTLDEEDLCKLMKWELTNQRRLHVLNRVKSRYNRIRDSRERAEFVAEMEK
jgi:hypothetical protein